MVGETLVCRHDTRAEAKRHDDFAVGIYLVDNQDDGQKPVGHVPIEPYARDASECQKSLSEK